MASKLAFLIAPLLGCSAHSELHEAVRTCDIPIVEQLIASGAPINEKDPAWNTPLHEAVRAGKPACVYLLLAADANRYPPNRAGQAAFLLASINALLAKGADVSAPTRDSHESALHIAAGWGRLDAVRALLTAGASRSARDAKGRTPADIAAANNFKEIVDVLNAAKP